MTILVVAVGAFFLDDRRRGWVLWDEGRLEGDDSVIEDVEAWECLWSSADEEVVDLDWWNPEHARVVLGVELYLAYGRPVRFFEGSGEEWVSDDGEELLCATAERGVVDSPVRLPATQVVRGARLFDPASRRSAALGPFRKGPIVYEQGQRRPMGLESSDQAERHLGLRSVD